MNATIGLGGVMKLGKKMENVEGVDKKVGPNDVEQEVVDFIYMYIYI